MTVREAVAWLRICRPGSVTGQQQFWLEKIQSWLWRIGNQDRLQHYREEKRIPKNKHRIYSNLWAVEQEKLQSERSVVCSSKRTVSKEVVQMSSKKAVVNKALGHVKRPIQGDKLHEIKA